MKYHKEPLSIEDQINLLKDRNLIIEDEVRAQNYLLNISYYRLSAYMLPFRVNLTDGSHTFKEGTTFDDILNLYLFDRELRLIIFDIIERLEVAFRSQITYHNALKHGPWWFEYEEIFKNEYYFHQCVKKIEEEVDRSNETFIKHYQEKYTEPNSPPAWMAFEVISMGLLSKIFKNLKTSDSKKKVSKHFKVPTTYIFESWLHSLSHVRNICAHHGRLWNRTLTVKPELLKSNRKGWIDTSNVNQGKIYAFMSCTIYLLKTINPNTSVCNRFKELLEKYPNIDTRAMGFPIDWDNESLWQ